MMKTKFSMVLDGEIMSRSFQNLMQHFNRKTTEVIDSYYAAFDVLSIREFRNGISENTFEVRMQMLSELQPLLLEHCGSSVWTIPNKIVNLSTTEGRQECKEFMDECVAAGYEGIMAKDANAFYECKRSTSWLKLKPKIAVTLKIVGTEPGEPGKKFANTLGALICEGYGDGADSNKFIKTKVGGGFKDSVRKDIWENRDKVIDQLVEVEADCIIDGKGGKDFSLRFPEFKSFRSINRITGQKD